MSLSASITPHLPYLRRYARALTGSQQSGDACVAALLQSLVDDPSAISEARDVRIALYAGLAKLWKSVSVAQKPQMPGSAWEAAVQEKLAAMDSPERQIFLLKAVEGFDFDQIAEIHGLPVSEIKRIHDRASRQVAEMMASDILIIEDEALIALDLEEIVTSLGHKSVGIARTHSEAVRMADDNPPDLILSDIQLADNSSGIEAVNEILESFDVPVIFITAFPERLLTGERPEPAFLVSKPYSVDMIKAVIAQALFFNVKPKNGAASVP